MGSSTARDASFATRAVIRIRPDPQIPIKQAIQVLRPRCTSVRQRTGFQSTLLNVDELSSMEDNAQERHFIQAITPALWIMPEGGSLRRRGRHRAVLPDGSSGRKSNWDGWTPIAGGLNGRCLWCALPQAINNSHTLGGAICSSTSRTDHKRSHRRGRQRRSCRGGDMVEPAVEVAKPANPP